MFYWRTLFASSDILQSTRSLQTLRVAIFTSILNQRCITALFDGIIRIFLVCCRTKVSIIKKITMEAVRAFNVEVNMINRFTESFLPIPGWLCIRIEKLWTWLFLWDSFITMPAVIRVWIWFRDLCPNSYIIICLYMLISY